VRGRAFDEDDGLAVETRIAHHQAGGDRHFDPAVSQHINREQSAAGNRVAIQAQLVVDARQRRIDGSGFAVESRDSLARAARGIRRSEVLPNHQERRLCADLVRGAQAHDQREHDKSCAGHRGLSRR
jgi:hypothetical protein